MGKTGNWRLWPETENPVKFLQRKTKKIISMGLALTVGVFGVLVLFHAAYSTIQCILQLILMIVLLFIMCLSVRARGSETGSDFCSRQGSVEDYGGGVFRASI